MDIASISIKADSTEVKTATNDLNKLNKTAHQTDSATAKASKGFGTMSAALKVLGPLLASTALFSFIKKSVEVTKEFEKSLSELSAITGATGKDLNILARASRDLGKETTLSASQVATAFKLVASAKPDLLESAEALKMVTKETIVLAEAAGIALPEAANILGSALNQFGAEADKASKFINVIAAGSKFGAASIADMAGALKASGTTAAAANISFEETNAALQALSTVAIKGEQAGTSLRNVILKLQKEGIDNLNPAVVGLNKSLQNLAKENKSTTELIKLFGLENVNAAKALINQADSLDVLTGKITDTSIAYEQAGIQTDNLVGDIARLNSAWEESQLILGTELVPELRYYTQYLTEIIGLSNELYDVGLKQELADLNSEWVLLTREVKEAQQWLDKFVWSGEATKQAIELTAEALNEKAERLAVVNKLIEELESKMSGATTTAKKFNNAISGEADAQYLAYLKNQIDLEKKLQKVKEAANRAAENKLIEEKKALLAEHNKLLSETARITESLRTPQEVYNDTIERNIQLMKTAGMTQETFDRAKIAAQKSLTASTKQIVKTVQEAEKLASPFEVTWNRTIERLDNSFANMWDQLLQGGIDSMDFLKDVARKFLAEMIHLFTTQKIVASFSATLAGGASGIAGAAGGSNNYLSTASNIYKAGSAIFGGASTAGIYGSAIGTGAFGAGALGAGSLAGAAGVLGTGAAGAAVGGIGATSFAAGAAATGATMGATAALGTGAAGAAVGGIGAAGGMMSGIGAGLAAMGPVGWAALAVGIIVASGALGSNSDVSPDMSIWTGDAASRLVGSGGNDVAFNAGSRYGSIGVSTQHDYFESDEAAAQFTETVATRLNILDEAIFQAVDEGTNAAIEAVTGKNWETFIKFEEGGSLEGTMTKRFDRIFGAMNNSLEEVYNVMKDRGQAGEEAAASTLLLNTQTNALIPIFDALNLKLLDSSADSLLFTESLIAVAGGFDQLAGKLDFYYKNFFTGTEQAETTLKNAAEAVRDFGVANVHSIPLLRAYIEGLDDSADNYDELLNAALDLAPVLVTAANAHDYLNQEAQKTTDAINKQADADRKFREQQDKATKQAQNTIKGYITALVGKTEIDTAIDSINQLNEVYGTQFDYTERGKESLLDWLRTFDASNPSIQRMVDGLGGVIDAFEMFAKRTEETKTSLQGYVDTLSNTTELELAKRTIDDINLAYGQQIDYTEASEKKLLEWIKTLDASDPAVQAAINDIGRLTGAFGVIGDAARQTAADVATAAQNMLNQTNSVASAAYGAGDTAFGNQVLIDKWTHLLDGANQWLADQGSNVRFGGSVDEISNQISQGLQYAYSIKDDALIKTMTWARAEFTKDVNSFNAANEPDNAATNTATNTSNTVRAIDTSNDIARDLVSVMEQNLQAIKGLRQSIQDDKTNIMRQMPGFNEVDFQTGVISELQEKLTGSAGDIEIYDQIRQAVIARYDAEMESIEKTRISIGNMFDGVKDFIENMNLSALSPLTNKQRLDEAASKFFANIRPASAGNEDALSKMPELAQTYLTEARAFYASSDQYQVIWDTVRDMLNRVATSGDRTEERLKAYYEATGTSAEDIQQDTLSTLTQLDNSVLSLEGTLIASFQKQTQSLWDKLDISTMLLISALSGTSTSPIGSSSAVASFAVGTDYVPSDGLAYIHKGEAVIPAKDNAQLHEEIKLLRQEVTLLRTENNQNSDNIIQANFAASDENANTIIEGQQERTQVVMR